MKKISELKDFGYINIFGTFLISFFFYLLHYYARKNEFGFFGLHIYICFIANGYFIIHHIKGGWKTNKTDKSIFDSLVLVPTIGAIAFAFWFIIFVILDNFTKFSFYFMYLLPVEFL